ncbi:MAG: FmdE family protein [Candidatus Helarchaeota archaeon]
MLEIPPELQKAAEFHGHLCPGLAIGYRVGILARKELGLTRSEDEELVAIVENDSCAVDAIQFITGATFGKGNLIFQDHGLQAYTFIERNSGKQVRIELKADAFKEKSDNLTKIREKINNDLPLSEDEKAVMQKFREDSLKTMIEAPDDELFNVKQVNITIPEKAHIYSSVKCSKCGLMVMETRARVKNKKFYCIPCWEEELKTG